jgi:hypothetical protein
MNSPVTSVTGLRLYQSAIAPCFVFWRENSRAHFGTFATQSAHRVTSLRRTIMPLLVQQRTSIGTGTECIGRE